VLHQTRLLQQPTALFGFKLILIFLKEIEISIDHQLRVVHDELLHEWREFTEEDSQWHSEPGR